jgi:hypothetical protein|uniref:Uncharacterized protein n=1 Tax=viral metagenome TaxID=1070528 RepID=A0A6C0BXX7_9ZZZZ
MSSLLKVFNNHLVEFLNDFQIVMPNNNIKAAVLFINTTKKINPSIFIKGWINYIYNPYKEKIKEGDFTFFIERDYSSDIDADDDNKVLEIINTIRTELKKLDENNREKVIKYVQNLTKMGEMYQIEKNL